MRVYGILKYLYHYICSGKYKQKKKPYINDTTNYSVDHDRGNYLDTYK